MFNGIPLNSYKLACFYSWGLWSKGSAGNPLHPQLRGHSCGVGGAGGQSAQPRVDRKVSEARLPDFECWSRHWLAGWFCVRFLAVRLNLLVGKTEQALQRAAARMQESALTRRSLQCAALFADFQAPTFQLPHQGLMSWSMQIKPLKHFTLALHCVSDK